MFDKFKKKKPEISQTLVRIHVSSNYYSDILLVLHEKWKTLDTNIPDLNQDKLSLIIGELEDCLWDYLKEKNIESFEELDDDGKDYVISYLLNEFFCSKFVFLENLLVK